MAMLFFLECDKGVDRPGPGQGTVEYDFREPILSHILDCHCLRQNMQYSEKQSSRGCQK